MTVECCLDVPSELSAIVEVNERLITSVQVMTTQLNSINLYYNNCQTAVTVTIYVQSGPQKTVPYIILFKMLLHLFIRTK